MKSDKASLSARATATLRALHQRLPEDQRIMHDPAAETFVTGPISRIILRFRPLTRWAISRKPTASVLIAMRDRFADEWARRTLVGRSQLLLLGAGYDPTTLRLGAEFPETVFYEVDHPATQKAKQALLARKKLMLPPERCKFVASNFEVDDLKAGLLAAGFDRTLPTFVNWMGVTYYLPVSAIHQTLKIMSELLAPGSILTMDYFHPGVNLQDTTRWGWMLNRFSEPLKTFLSDDDVKSMVAEHCFEPAELILAREYARRQNSKCAYQGILVGLVALRRLPN